MPGDKALLEEFIDRQLAATPEDRVIASMVRRVFAAMTLAGEAGSLLKIEEEISTIVDEAKRQWQAESRTKQSSMFGEPTQTQLDVSSITDGSFWVQAEERIYAALSAYASQAENGEGYRRRLFADDAARGFAFIDICRRLYDVVLMNPPFGEISVHSMDYLRINYPTLCENLYCGFFQRTIQLLSGNGLTGAITDRSFLTKQSYEPIRRQFTNGIGPKLIVDLGWNVLDANVETCLTILSSQPASSLFLDISIFNETKDKELLYEAKGLTGWISEQLTNFNGYPFCSYAYSMPEWMKRGYRNSNNRIDLSFCRAVRGMVGGNADHMYRLMYEIPSSNIGWNNEWVLLQKGSPFSPFYFGPEQLLRTEKQTFRSILSYDAGRVTGREDYGRHGLAFGKRTDYMYAYIMQPQQIFSMEGQAIFPLGSNSCWQVLAVVNSSVFQDLVNRVAGQHKVHGYINSVHLLTENIPDCSAESMSIWKSLQELDSHNETACHFIYPRVIGLSYKYQFSLSELIEKSISNTDNKIHKCYALQTRIDTLIEESLNVTVAPLGASKKADYVAILFGQTDSAYLECSSIISFLLGSVFGRWDIRYATSERAAPTLPDPFAPLPVCPPGMLQNDQGLPAGAGDVPASYPLRISWSGILVDDEGHPEDVEGRVREAVAVIWGERVETIEQEASTILGVKSLRDYFRKSSNFFADHLGRYSKSRRQAPIYWPLSTPSGGYTLWLYYHRLSDQTLYTCVNDFVEPKLRQVADQSAALRQKTGRSARDEKELEHLTELGRELRDFRDELLRVASFWKPNLNDGVQITAAPLWRLFQHKPWQKKLKETWESLERGDYDWAHLAYSIWPERVREKCRSDKSLAIAHDLEELYVAPSAAAGKKRGAKKQAALEETSDED
jgi:hypothetical protein